MEMLTPESFARSQDAKRRRIQHSSTDHSDVSLISARSVASSTASFTLERGRVAIPARKLLPLNSIDPPDKSPALIAFRQRVAQIHQCLVNRSVQFNERNTCLVYRVIPDEEPVVDDLTVLIIGNWSYDDLGDNWFLAANDIKELINLSSSLRSVSVEIVGWHLLAERIFRALERGHPVVAAWPRLRPKIHAIIDDSPVLNEGWLSIDVLRMEYVDYPNPKPIVISITVDWHLDRKHWLVEERKIREELFAEKLADVQVEFKRGTYTNSFATSLE